MWRALQAIKLDIIEESSQTFVTTISYKATNSTSQSYNYMDRKYSIFSDMSYLFSNKFYYAVRSSQQCPSHQMTFMIPIDIKLLSISSLEILNFQNQVYNFFCHNRNLVSISPEMVHGYTSFTITETHTRFSGLFHESTYT